MSWGCWAATGRCGWESCSTNLAHVTIPKSFVHWASYCSSVLLWLWLCGWSGWWLVSAIASAAGAPNVLCVSYHCDSSLIQDCSECYIFLKCQGFLLFWVNHFFILVLVVHGAVRKDRSHGIYCDSWVQSLSALYRLHMSKWFPSDSLLQYSHSCLVEVSSVWGHR